ncbi:Sec-independent protein translocase subunit TatA [Salinifilum aidingensis]
MGLPGGWELVVIVLVLVALFGASKLPKMARSLGQSARAFKAEARGLREDDEKAKRESAERTDRPDAELTSGDGSAPPVTPNEQQQRDNTTNNQ